MRHIEDSANLTFGSLLRHLEEWKPASEPESLHLIRVDIKKIKAILSVVNEDNKKFKTHKHYKPIREIFRYAGAIRESEVLKGLLLRYQIEEEDVFNLDYNKEAISAFESGLPQFIKDVKLLRKSLKDYLKHISREDLKKYIRKKRKVIKLKLWPEPQMHCIHKTRKAIKEMIYISQTCDMLEKDELNFYARIEDIIGKMHDNQVLIELLNAKNQLNRKALNAIESECISYKKEIFLLVNEWYKNHSRL